MNRSSQVLGVVGLTVLAFACSSRDEEPVPFSPARISRPSSPPNTAPPSPSGHVCVVENAATRAAKLDSNGAMACEPAK